ncbi:MAG: DUF815 domain-containing protein [archaeon]|nr:zonular occludens toxin domain-containing protein [Nanoarchaeota archaeon]
MKKRTKNKIKKGFKNAFLYLLEDFWKLIVLIFKGIYYGIKYMLKGIWIAIVFFYKKITGLFTGRSAKAVENEEETDNSHESEKSEIKVNKVKGVSAPKDAKFQEFRELKKKKGNIETFNNFLYDNKSTIGIILGARGTGKSAIGMSFLENFASKSEKKLYALGFKQNALPHWIRVVKSIEEIENNSVLLVDEGGIEFSSRSSMTNANKLLSDILLVARHKDLSVMFITQNSSNLEVNAIRQADYLILKPSSLLQKDFERKKIKEVYESVDKDFEDLKEDRGLTYLYSDKYCGFISNDLPSFWSEKVSKGYAGK